LASGKGKNKKEIIKMFKFAQNRWKKVVGIIAVVLMIAVIFSAFPIIGEAASGTYLGPVNSSVSPTSISKSQSATFKTSVQLLGNGRSSFNPTSWALAWGFGWKEYSIQYTVDVRKDITLWTDTIIVSPVTYKRTATIYPSDPFTTGSSFWVKIKLEDGSTVTPKSLAQAQSLMFDFNKSYSIQGTKLGTGTFKLHSTIAAKWSGYVSSGSDKQDTNSPRVTITVKK
jgi:hypothetical protein